MEIESKIFVAGHNGMVGSAITRKLNTLGYKNIISFDKKDLDLLDQKSVFEMFKNEKLDYLFIAAAKVGGINANNRFKGEFIYENIVIQSNLIHAAHINKVKKLIFLGSACIYPKNSKQPILEEYLLNGKLEPTNEPYAIAKIAGIKTCESYFKQYKDNFISIMPNNLYGPNDNYDLANSHVLPALIRKFHEAKIKNKSEVKIWGSGKPLREFLHVDDLADATIFIMNQIDAEKIYNNNISHLNVGTGDEISIADLALLVKSIVSYNGNIKLDIEKPDGMMRKLLDCTRLHSYGWSHKINLEDGIKKVYKSFKKNYSAINL